MRYFAIALAALLISVPAAAVAGPDALSIAKRALRLAQEPSDIVQISSERTRQNEGYLIVSARCPHGTVAVGLLPHSGQTEFVSAHLSGRRAYAVFQIPEDYPAVGPRAPSITVTCVEGELRKLAVSRASSGR